MFFRTAFWRIKMYSLWRFVYSTNLETDITTSVQLYEKFVPLACSLFISTPGLHSRNDKQSLSMAFWSPRLHRPIFSVSQKHRIWYLRGVAMHSRAIIVALFVLYLLTKSSTAGWDVCIRRASAFRRLRVLRYVGISFSLIARLYYATGKTRILHIRIRRDVQRSESSVFSFIYEFLFTLWKCRQRQILS